MVFFIATAGVLGSDGVGDSTQKRPGKAITKDQTIRFSAMLILISMMRIGQTSKISKS